MSEPGLTDESIDQIVKMVEGAEVLAMEMEMPVSRAVRFMLKSAQTMAKLQNDKLSGVTFPKGVQ